MTQGKRKHLRIPVDKLFMEQVEIFRSNSSGKELDRVKGIVNNISAGGLMATVEEPVKLKDFLSIVFRWPGGLESQRVLVQTVWVSGAGFRKALGLQFKNLPGTAADLLNKITTDYTSCEKRIGFSLKDICQRHCAFWSLCRKPVKLKIAGEYTPPPSEQTASHNPPSNDPFDWSGNIAPSGRTGDQGRTWWPRIYNSIQGLPSH